MTQLILLFLVGFILTVIFKSYSKFQNENPYNKAYQGLEVNYTNIANSELGLFVALIAKVAKSDGKVDELEAELISNLFNDISSVFSDKEHTKSILKEIFNNEKNSTENLDKTIAQLNQLLKHDENKKIQMSAFLFNLAFIDGEFSKAEEEMIEYICFHLHVSKENYEHIKSTFQDNFTHVKSHSTISDAYKQLNSKKGDSLQEIKKRYRALVKEHHPDIIKAQGKDESYIQNATKRVQEINEAYETVKKDLAS